MTFVLMLASVLLPISFESTLDRAFALARNDDWTNASAVLDQAYVESPELFAANNLHYLRGRSAENQRDWRRALEAFKQIDAANPLYTLAAWHAARASAQLGDDAGAEEFLRVLPRDFPADLKMQMARESSTALAIKIYLGVSTREARFQLAKLAGDTGALRSLIHESQNDDIALGAARLLAGSASTAGEQMDIAGAFAANRQYEDALPLYQKAAEDPGYTPDARYRIARIQFFREDYRLAIETYRAIAEDFPDTDWQKDSEFQIAACYWQLGELSSSEKAYLGYIDKYSQADEDEGAVRNLVDIYRSLGENQKALTWIDRALAGRLSAAGRQVMLFTKAKVLYTQQRYTAALQIFRQLEKTRIRSVPGGTTPEEVQYFQGLCLSKSGSRTAAETIWRRLARDPFSYYGQRATEQLGTGAIRSRPQPCSPTGDAVTISIEAKLETLRHPLRSQMDPMADAVSELAFLRLWDEASLWLGRTKNRLPPQTAAQIAYVARQYHRAIAYADRLPRNEPDTLALMYPVGFRQIVCSAAATYKVDPLWLHAIIWQESKYNPNAKSGAAARGLMQLIPETARAVGTAAGMPALSPEALYDPSVNIQLGARLWSSLVEKLKSPEMALAAYNGGPGNVERWDNKGAHAPGDKALFVADIGFVETKKYVMAVFAARAAYGRIE